MVSQSGLRISAIGAYMYSGFTGGSPLPIDATIRRMLLILHSPRRVWLTPIRWVWGVISRGYVPKTYAPNTNDVGDKYRMISI